jgi:hypothetical protein
MGFIPPDVKAEVREFTDKEWELLRTLEYEGQRDSYSIEVTSDLTRTTDFASVPRIFAWFIPSYGRYTKPAILHDYLWRELAAKGTMRWIDADGIFRRAMREVEVPFLRRWIMWAAVRWAALLKPDGRRGWWREMPRVLLVTVVALPLVAPPAAVIVVALLVYQLVEWIVWVPLKLGAMVKDRLGAPRKAVIPPRLSFRL